LHGGPGADHRYFEGFEDSLPLNGIEFYYYDQLDSTNSEKPDDPALWTIQRYTDEVEAVRKGLGLDDFYLLGHSWGGLLAIEYALKYQQHLRGLVNSNMAASADCFVKQVSKLRSQFPDDVRAKLELYENANKTDDPAFQKLLLERLYKIFICRLDPWPDPVLRSLGGWNQHVYKVLQGRSEFEATGRMKGWNRWNDLPKIKVRTLTMGGIKAGCSLARSFDLRFSASSRSRKIFARYIFGMLRLASLTRNRFASDRFRSCDEWMFEVNFRQAGLNEVAGARRTESCG